MINRIAICLAISFTSIQAYAEDLAVKITPRLSAIDVKHAGKNVNIHRNQDQNNMINDNFSLTSRKCPPFCIQPIKLADGVETIGEIKMLDYLKRHSEGNDDILIIDSRGAAWLKRGTIPGSINIHYKKLKLSSADESSIAELFEDKFNVQRTAEFWNFKHAKTLVLFCNGMWCGQAPTNIKSLLKLGYPPSKLKWYRGGMQSWEISGLTTVK